MRMGEYPITSFMKPVLSKQKTLWKYKSREKYTYDINANFLNTMSEKF